MATVQERRRTLLIVVGVMLLFDVLAAGYLLLPAISSPELKREQLRQLEEERQIKTKQVAPLGGIDQKLDTATQQIQTFFDERLPSRTSEVAERLGGVANKFEVELTAIRYTAEQAEIPGLERLQIEATLVSDYRELARFISALERDPMFFVISSVSLAGMEQGDVRVQLRLQTYRKVQA